MPDVMSNDLTSQSVSMSNVMKSTEREELVGEVSLGLNTLLLVLHSNCQWHFKTSIC